jgi:hypothetical protein
VSWPVKAICLWQRARLAATIAGDLRPLSECRTPALIEEAEWTR